jgi:hypothetical protein
LHNKPLIVATALIAAIALAPVVSAEVGDQADAEAAVQAVYGEITCGSPPMPMHFTGIQWSRFYPASGGEGRIVDADPHLGGPFTIVYTNPKVGPPEHLRGYRNSGQWSVNLQFC